MTLDFTSAALSWAFVTPTGTLRPWGAAPRPGRPGGARTDRRKPSPFAAALAQLSGCERAHLAPSKLPPLLGTCLTSWPRDGIDLCPTASGYPIRALGHRGGWPPKGVRDDGDHTGALMQLRWG